MQQRSRPAARKPLTVLLVGFQDQDNLGLRYLKSAVDRSGHNAVIETFSADPAPLIEAASRCEPDVIGFSLIFQYMAPQFGTVIAAMREAGITSHITIGGHYPSFDYAEVLAGMPGLDSVVRYEGELTLVELMDRLAEGAEWRGLDGIACRGEDGQPRSNRLREPVADLDTLPMPDRTSIAYETHPFPTASILGSRGCPWNCTFCSIRPFYEDQGGKLRRLRDPSRVVDEMIELFEARSVRAFLFQDDDFLATGRRARQWAIAIADDIVERGYGDRLVFKMSCRSDEIDEDTTRRLMRGGLTHVYMGVESGDDAGLANMNKMIRRETHLKAAEILKSLGVSFDFGFMLMDPSSTFASIRNNIDFLEAFVGDGWSVAPFCRMLPYAGTPVKRTLEAEGRLAGNAFNPDYSFLDEKLDLFYDWMLNTFHTRNFTSEGLCHLLRYSIFESRLRLDGYNVCSPMDVAELQCIAAICNGVACNTLRAGLDHVEQTPIETLRKDTEYLDGLTALEQREEQRLTTEYWAYRDRIDARRNAAIDGGFDRSWTHFGGDREAAGIGAA